MVYAMGDGNHSLAAAKECFRRLTEALGDSVTFKEGNAGGDATTASPLWTAFCQRGWI